MWEWFLTECKNAVCKNRVPINDQDDLISDMLYELTNHPDLAKEIYETKNDGKLYGIAKNLYLKSTAKQFYDTPRDFFRYCELVKVSKQYNVPLIVENAYIFSAILGKNPYTICYVASLLQRRKSMCVTTTSL